MCSRTKTPLSGARTSSSQVGQPQVPAGTAWTCVFGSATMRAMPLDLTDSELATGAQACRAMAYQEGERAKRTKNPTVRGPIEAAAQRYTTLAEKFEAARRERAPS